MQGVNDGNLLISGLQHFSFCRRQWALIHIEMQWDDNYLTVDGSLRHEKADDPEFTEKRGGLIVSRAMPVRSDRYGIVGKCDVVEFRADPSGVPIVGREGLWLPTPVEYKRGRSKVIDADRLQLCAEAICLEEMLCCPPILSAYTDRLSLLYGDKTPRGGRARRRAARRGEPYAHRNARALRPRVYTKGQTDGKMPCLLACRYMPAASAKVPVGIGIRAGHLGRR